MSGSRSEITGAEWVVPGRPLDETLAFFRDRLGFRVESIRPADDPAVYVVAGHGVRIRLDARATDAPGTLRLRVRNPAPVAVAPNGTRVEFVASDPPLVLPPHAPELRVTRLDAGAFHVGRAGMRYRDLIPGRLGGRYIASHIVIDDEGPVADYPHSHRVRFQMIYCSRGWVEVVYEDQGPPFVLRAGDCVLQPPRIGHRVLRSSAGLEVIEVGCPADHVTDVEHALDLPTARVDRDRDFDGQRFTRHVAADAAWSPWSRFPGFEARDLGISSATAGLADATVARPRRADAAAHLVAHDEELQLYVLLAGRCELRVDAMAATMLSAGDAVVIPAGTPHAPVDRSGDLELLVVTVKNPAG